MTDRTAAKIWAKHQVSVEEVAEAVEHPEGQMRRAKAGRGAWWSRTESGRALVIILKPPEAAAEAAVIITVREMTPGEKKVFRRGRR